MEPISVAASIIGVVTATFQVSKSLSKFTSSVKNAPQLAHSVLSEVSDVRFCLVQLQGYLDRTSTNSRSYEKLLMVDDIRVVLSNCVMIFSELEQVVAPFNSKTLTQAGRKAQWALKKQDIQLLLKRLKSSQTSLNLILTTMTW